MNRRGFLNIMSLGAVGAPAIALGATSKNESNFDKDGPICTDTLTIQSGTKKKKVKKADFNGLSFYSDDYEEHKQISMAVGRDGDLWIKNDQGIWKRVVTE